MTMILALALHILGAVVWVGGMVFAYTCLRPAVPGIEPPPERLKLWRRVFARFLPLVWVAVIAILASGYWVVFAEWGGFGNAGAHVHTMQGSGLIMVALFAHLFFAEWKHFRHAVDGEDWETGRFRLERIRTIVFINTWLGLLTVVIGATGRYWG